MLFPCHYPHIPAVSITFLSCKLQNVPPHQIKQKRNDSFQIFRGAQRIRLEDKKVRSYARLTPQTAPRRPQFQTDTSAYPPHWKQEDAARASSTALPEKAVLFALFLTKVFLCCTCLFVLLTFDSEPQMQVSDWCSLVTCLQPCCKRSCEGKFTVFTQEEFTDGKGS